MKMICAALAALMLCACASAPHTSAPWVVLTARDVEAAYQLLAEDHPAMSPDLSTAAFRADFEAGRALALERARSVRDYDGYRAVLAGLAASAGDKHIWSRPLYQPETVQWAGLIVSRRRDRYVVIEHDGAEAGASLVGAALISCDDVAVDDFAAQKLGGFRAVWSIEAQRIQRAPELLIDDGNPFVLRPNTCVFDQGGRGISHTLAWRDLARSALADHTRPARNRGAAGFGVRSFAGGMWISVQSLDDRAAAVVEAVEAQQAALRAAPVVVLDLRGNGGGASDYGRQIAMALYGETHVRAMLDGAEGGDCPSVWRVSPRNAETMRDYAQRFRDSAPEFAASIDAQIAAAARAQAEGRDFTGPTTCAADADTAPAAPPAPAQVLGRVVLLTDNSCFSSCLLVTDAFRRLGALHVGQATDANTHYMEVRELRLPSGLSMFSTLQALGPAAPPQIGPFAPAHVYGGDIADTPALEAWVAEVAAGG